MQVKTYGSKVPSNQNKKAKQAARRRAKALLAVLCTLVTGFIVVAVLLVVKLTSHDYSSILVEPDQAANALAADNNQIVGYEEAPKTKTLTYNGKTYQKNDAIVNLLFLGIDTDSERKQQRMGYRSDMMMVCAVDTVKKSATLLSIPRDTYTDVDIIRDGKVEETVKNKLNAAYAFGGGPDKYSAENAKNCVQRFLQRECELENALDFTLDIPINFYASIDMDGIVPVTKAVDGVEVTLEESIPDVGKKGETVKLKYQNAQDYLRNRHDSDDSDFGRTSHQRAFMIALAKKIKNMGPVDALTKLYDELNQYVKTDLNLDQILDFAKILKDVNIDNIELLTVPGKTAKIYDDNKKEKDVVFHDEQATLDMLLNIYYIPAA